MGALGQVDTALGGADGHLWTRAHGRRSFDAKRHRVPGRTAPGQALSRCRADVSVLVACGLRARSSARVSGPFGCVREPSGSCTVDNYSSQPPSLLSILSFLFPFSLSYNSSIPFLAPSNHTHITSHPHHRRRLLLPQRPLPTTAPTPPSQQLLLASVASEYHFLLSLSLRPHRDNCRVPFPRTGFTRRLATQVSSVGH